MILNDCEFKNYCPFFVESMLSMSVLEKATKLIPLLSILVITLGFVYYRTFYMSFGIRVVDYLELSEILTLFLDELYILYGAIGAIITINISLHLSSYRKAKEREAEKNSINIERTIFFSNKASQLRERKLVQKAHLQKVFWRMALPTIGFGLLSYLLVYKHLAFLESVSIVSFGAYVGLIFGEYIADLEVFGRTRFLLLGGNPLQIIVLIIVTLNAARASSQIRVNDIKEKHSNKNIAFVLDETLITSDTVCYYLGKTKNFLFYYNAEQQKATVYPMSRIKQISFSK